MAKHRIAFVLGVCVLGVGVAAIAFFTRPTLDWGDLEQWQGANVLDNNFQSFVRNHALVMRHSNECGTLSDSRNSFWMNVRKSHIVRVAVRIRPRGSDQHVFIGRLDSRVRVDDNPDSIIRKFGAATHDITRSQSGGRYLVYEPSHLVFDFDSEGALFEIRQGNIDQ